MELEHYLAEAILGQPKASVLMTDGYKFAMAQAGFPLREETFVFTLRKGGPFYIPVDLNAVVQRFLPDVPTVKEGAFLTANGYGLTPAMEQALKGSVKVWAAPKGSWVMAGEPVLTVTGPSFLVSWLEPLVIMLHYPIQIATAWVIKGEQDFTAVCQDEARIITLVAEAVGTEIIRVEVDERLYRQNVTEKVGEVLQALNEGEGHRAFEVGLRGATCIQQHMMVLEECRKQGVLKTSNVWGAWKLYMIPVGTTGHEHQERWGMQDENGFRAIRDMRPEPPSYLFDTHDPLNLGIPTAFKVIEENPDRPCSLRFDSGDQDEQFKTIRGMCSRNTEKALFEAGLTDKLSPLRLTPNLIFEDGYTAEKTFMNEALCEKWGWPRENRMYGYGGFFVSTPHPSPYNRDLVSAAFKLCWSNGPRMKFSGTPGKGSIPGKPVILRRVSGLPQDGSADSLIGQEGEVLEGYLPLNETNLPCTEVMPQKSGKSPETWKILKLLHEERNSLIKKV